ncbi:MAG: GNAT family N-acetyltransferase [Thiotrichaceae bacterium]
MKIIYQLSSQQIVDLHGLYKNEWWTENRSREETEACVKGSQVCIGLIDENEVLKGFVRVITDFTFKALVLDLIIEKEHRGQGLSKQLMSHVMKHKDLIKVKHFELYCLPELEGFYKQFNFSDNTNGVKLLRHVS